MLCDPESVALPSCRCARDRRCRQGNCASGSSARTSSSRAEGFVPTPLREEEVLPERASFNVLTLQRRPLRDHVVTRGRIETADLFGMTIPTREAAILIDRIQLFVQILSGSVFVMTLSARRNRHVRLQPTQ